MPNWLTLESAVFGSYGAGFIIGDMGNPVEPIEVPDSKVELLLCIVHGGRPFVYDDSWLERPGKVVEHASLKLGTRSPFLVEMLLNDKGHVFVSSHPAPLCYVLEGDTARRFLEVCGMRKAREVMQKERWGEVWHVEWISPSRTARTGFAGPGNCRATKGRNVCFMSFAVSPGCPWATQVE